MDKNSPYYWYDPTSPGSIIRKHRAGEHICAAHVARVLKADPDAVNDPLIQDYALRMERNELPKRAGRPARRIGRYGWFSVAHMRAQEKMAAWREARRANAPHAPRKGRGEQSLPELAYADVAKEMKLNMSGRALANVPSAMKRTHPLFL